MKAGKGGRVGTTTEAVLTWGGPEQIARTTAQALTILTTLKIGGPLP